MTVRAYAKINLGLRILRNRGDGYHEIETVFHRINWFDELRFEPSSFVSLTCNEHHLPVDERNLCVRAVGLLQKTFAIHQGVHITLKKNIPVGAGLGGGSADAAAVLTYLPHFWEEKIGTEELFHLALQLGSDVPYFLLTGSASAKGRGELLEYFDFDLPYWIVVAYPKIHVSTGWAYGNLQLATSGELISLREILERYIHEPQILREKITNDFEPLVLGSHERIAQIKRLMYDRGAAFSQLSGSGSSVYGFFEDQPRAEAVSQELLSTCRISLTPPHFRPRPGTGLE